MRLRVNSGNVTRAVLSQRMQRMLSKKIGIKKARVMDYFGHNQLKYQYQYNTLILGDIE